MCQFQRNTFINVVCATESISGPLLFIFYMNYIHNVSNKLRAILFPDVPNLTRTLCFFNANLKYNFNKAQFSHNNHREIGQCVPVIILKGQQIEEVKVYNFLCLILEENMTWSGHVKK